MARRLSSTDPLAGRIIGGLLLQIVGTAVALSTDDDALAPLCWIVAGVGSILVLIGCVGWGVLAGLRAHASETRDRKS